MKSKKTLLSLIWGGLFFWVLLFVAQQLKLYNPDKISNLAAQCEFILHFFILLALVLGWRRITPQQRIIWLSLLIMSIGLFLTDLSFYMAVYIPKGYVLSDAWTIFVLGYVPYIIFLIFSLIFLVNILLRGVLSGLFLAAIFPLFILMNMVIIFLFLSAIHYDFSTFSWELLSHVASLTAEFVIFDLALLCLIYSECAGFSAILIGLIILITGDFFINYSFLSQTNVLLPSGELLWFLGLMLMLFGLWAIQWSQSYAIQEWCSKTTRIKNKLALWTFGASLLSFLIFFGFVYFFSAVSREVCLGLPLFIMGYSIVVVGISIFIGKRFEAPFKKITANVEALMHNEKDKIDTDFSTEEFGFLQKFIFEAFDLKEAKDQAQKHLGKIAAQVAHDIGSPLSAINTCLTMLPQIPEEQRVLMRNSANRIQDIAKNLLAQYRGESLDVSEAYKVCLLAPLVESILAEKRIALDARNASINAEITTSGLATFAEFDAVEMKRMLSNLINNALEACPQDQPAIVTVFLDAKQHYIELSVTDNGVGMSPEQLEKMLSTGASTKAKGCGLGLSHARKVIESCGGNLTVSSALGEGTQVSLSLPRSIAPAWFVSEIQVSSAVPIGILDDEPSVHGAWDQRLLAVSKKLQIYHFRRSGEFIAWYQSQSMPVQVFSDYELLGGSMMGLDVLEQLQVGQNGLLVTSHYENPVIMERCQKQGIRLLPKNLLAHVPIILKATAVRVKKYDLILLDDNATITGLWEMMALSAGKNILVFNTIDALEEVLGAIDSTTPIYIDSELGQGIKGEEYAQTLFKRGFKELHLATGHEPEDFGHLCWIKEIVGKEPPFKI